MNGKELLTDLSYIDRKLIEESETGAIGGKSKKTVFKKPLLIAAILTLMVFLLGCAVVALHLEDLRIGQRPYRQSARYNEAGEKIPATEGVQDVISLQGIEGSANHQAAQEWFQFRQSYDPEHKLWSKDFTAPPEYDSYGAYTQEMVDKLAEICQKYDLRPLGRGVTDQYADWEMVQTALGIDGFLKDGAKAEARYDGGSFSESGNFNLYFYMTLTDPESTLEDELFVSYSYRGKAYFDNRFAAVDLEKAQQWNLTLEDGTTLLIVADDEQSHILCDRPDAFISIYLPTVWDRLDGTEGTICREDIERVAKAIDFSIQTRPVEDMDWVIARVEENVAAQENWTEDPAVTAERKRVFEENERKDSYAELIAQIRDNEEYFTTRGSGSFVAYQDFWETKAYALMDVTGDGEDELLLGQDGSILAIWTMEDGKTNYLQGTNATGNLCEGNVFRHYELVDGAPYYLFTDLADDGALIANVEYWRSEDCWYHEDYRAQREAREAGTATSTGSTPRVAITEEEANEIVQSYTIIPVEMKPVKDFPGLSDK